MKEILYKLFEHQYLGRKEAREILQGITQGKYNDAQIASLITVFLMRSISVEELIGFREALLEMRIPVDLNEFGPIDIVGTGGDGKNRHHRASPPEAGRTSRRQRPSQVAAHAPPGSVCTSKYPIFGTASSESSAFTVPA